MESGSLEMDTSTAPDPSVQSDHRLAGLRRRAWAQSRDSIWQESEAESCDPQGSQQNVMDGEEQRPSEEPGRVPNKITSWLIECRTPLGASLDDQSASPSRGNPHFLCVLFVYRTLHCEDPNLIGHVLGMLVHD
ncbi:protein ITPRID2-like [Perca fluviatilis]|uniref:protein ITPRID2-like n=1 Tax=Perca fluviatilis TaxID=8168 RepID=UPI001963C37C|nr:protein ITPRID2-like [Perca fluviatilis]